MATNRRRRKDKYVPKTFHSKLKTVKYEPNNKH